MPLNLLLRSEAGAPLTAVQHDANLTDIETLFNSLEAAMGVALDADGTLLAGAVDNAAVVADSILTLAKFAPGSANSFIATGPDGIMQHLGGVAGHVLWYNLATGVPSHVDPATLISSNVARYGNAYPELVINQSATQAAWTELDLSAYIVALGATDATWVCLKLKCTIPITTSGPSDGLVQVVLRITGDDALSTTSDVAHECVASAGFDASTDQCADTGTTEIWCKLDGTSVWWNTTFTNTTSTAASAKIYVVAFDVL